MKLKKILIILILTIIAFINSNRVLADEIEEETDFIWLQEQIANASADVMDEPNLDSRYVVAFDRNSKTTIFGKQENEQVPMASTTKIMTAIVLVENLEKNKDLNFNSIVEVCSKAGGIGGSRLGLKEGDKITIDNLLYGLMLCSRK